MATAQSTDISNLYRELFGRAPDQAGLDYWQSQAPALMGQGGTNKIREAMIGGAAQPDAQYYNNRNTSEADWANYTKRAEQQMAGMNNMPGVFADFGSISNASPAQAGSAMYHDQASLKAIMDGFKSLYGVGAIDQLGSLGGTTTKAKSSGGGILSRR